MMLSLQKGKRIRMHEFVCVLTLLLQVFHDWVIMSELKNVWFKLLRPNRPHINNHFTKACCKTLQRLSPDFVPLKMFCQERIFIHAFPCGKVNDSIIPMVLWNANYLKKSVTTEASDSFTAHNCGAEHLARMAMPVARVVPPDMEACPFNF